MKDVRDADGFCRRLLNFLEVNGFKATILRKIPTKGKCKDKLVVTVDAVLVKEEDLINEIKEGDRLLIEYSWVKK